MKTVMKKMFCLMLVAVLMVGVMPFQAFAANVEVTLHRISVPGGTPEASVTITIDDTNVAHDVEVSAMNLWGANYDPQAFSSAIQPGNQVYARMTAKICTKAVDCPAPVDHYPTCGTNCTGAFDCGTEAHKTGCLSQYACPSCGVVGQHLNENCPTLFCACGSSLASGLHTPECVKNCKNDRSCTSINHNPGCEGHLCDTPLCTVEESVAHTEHIGAPCSDSHCQKYLGHSGKHSYLCPEPGCDKPIHTGEHSLTCSTANCALKLGHAGDHKCGCGLLLQKGTQHNTGCPYYENPANNAVLYVWANLYTGQVKTGSILLDTITGLSGSEHIYQVMANNDGRIRSKIPAGYSWTGHVYYEQDPKTTLIVPTTLSVASEDDAIINLYTNQKLVVARVHTNKTYAIDHTINIDGFTVGQTVTSNDVLKAVQKHYNVSSLKMYTPAEWEKVVSGKTGTVIPNYEVHGGDNIIDVYVTGSYKTTSGTTYKADSSNPKTGDMIFAPAMVLGLSASALAVLFYLNKKRAF